MEKNKDFILKDKTMKVLLKLSYPLIISNIIATFYTMADGIWLARLSAKQFTATSFTWPVVFLFVSVAIGISIAGTSLISQSIGARNKERSSDYAKHLLFLSFIIGLSFSILGYFVTPLIVKVMGANGDLYKYSKIYLRINALGFLVDALYFSLQAILNAQGKTKDTTMMGLISGILNIILDPIFIFKEIPFIGLPGFGWEIFGAGFATVMAKIIALIIGYVRIKKDTTFVGINFNGFRYNRKTSRNIISLTIPTAVGRSAAALGFSVLNTFIISYGEEVVAAFSMVNRTTELFMQISMGFAAAMTSILGQNIGARYFDRARQVIKDANKLGWITSIIGMILIYFFQDPILSVFVDPNKDKAIFLIAKEYIAYDILMIPLMALFNVYQGLFQGAGKMKYSMHMSTLRLWIMRIPMILFFKNFTEIGRIGIWISMVASNVLIIWYSIYIFKTRDILGDRHVKVFNKKTGEN